MRPLRAPWVLATGLAATMLLAGCAQPADDCGTGTEFRNLDRTVRVCVPAGWTVSEHILGREIFLTSPYEDADDQFQENFNIARQHVASDMTLKEYVDATIDEVSRLQNVTYTPDRREDGKLGNMAAEVLVEDANVTGLHVSTIQLIAIQGNIVHVLTGVAEQGRAASFQAEFDYVARSYRAT